MKTLCVYHSIDLDGFMSAAIIKHWFNQQEIPNRKEEPINTLDFIGYNYGQPIQDLSEYDKVIMCDISFPKEEMYKLYERLKDNFIWIDHHISAIKDNVFIDDNICKGHKYNGLRDTKFAACELTWKYFFPNEPMPEIVRLLGRYDCFGHKTKSFEMSSDGYDKAKQYLKEVGKLKEFEDNKTSTDGYSLVHYANDVAKLLSEEQKVLEFQYGARQCIANYDEAYELLLNNLFDKNSIGSLTSIEKIHRQGKAIYSYLCTEAKQAYKNGFEIELSYPIKNIEVDIDEIPGKNDTIFEVQVFPFKFICINKERFNPINFGIDYHKDGYDGAACFHYDGVAKLWRFSLYNDNGLVDCSIIAKQFGGGGHFSASGFICNNETFLKIINNGRNLERHKRV